jgi:hypothetical protein
MGTVALFMVFFLEESKCDLPSLSGMTWSSHNHGVQTEPDGKEKVAQKPEVHLDYEDVKAPVITDPTQQPGLRRLVEIDNSIPLKTYRQTPIYSHNEVLFQ